jgi:hypothetical protein
LTFNFESDYDRIFPIPDVHNPILRKLIKKDFIRMRNGRKGEKRFDVLCKLVKCTRCGEEIFYMDAVIVFFESKRRNYCFDCSVKRKRYKTR